MEVVNLVVEVMKNYFVDNWMVFVDCVFVFRIVFVILFLFEYVVN